MTQQAKHAIACRCCHVCVHRAFCTSFHLHTIVSQELPTVVYTPPRHTIS